MEGSRPEGHITDRRSNMMDGDEKKTEKMEASSEGRQGPEGAVAPQMDG